MLPVLFAIGSVRFYTFGFLLAVGFFLTGFLLWRRLREHGLDEEKTIDFLLAFFFLSFLSARLGYILSHFELFGLSVRKWLLIGRFPGFAFWGFLLGGWLVLAWTSWRKKWSLGKIADELTFSLIPLLVLLQIGFFFDGTWVGKATGMPWGLFFPGDLIRRQPLALFGVIGFFLIWLFLLWLERRWRTWSFCQKQQEGFVTLIFVALACLLYLVLAFWEQGELYYLWTRKIAFASLFLIAVGFILGGSGIKVRFNSVKKKVKK